MPKIGLRTPLSECKQPARCPMSSPNLLEPLGTRLNLALLAQNYPNKTHCLLACWQEFCLSLAVEKRSKKAQFDSFRLDFALPIHFKDMQHSHHPNVQLPIVMIGGDTLGLQEQLFQLSYSCSSSFLTTHRRSLIDRPEGLPFMAV